MRNAETILGIIRERGRKRLPLGDVYRQLFNPALYLHSYARLYRNSGALTQGATAETVDGMSQGKIHGIIERVRRESYRWTPVRRVHIPKPKGGTRPLGIPTWSDKLLQDVVRAILEAYYEPRFSDRSHGFRPGRGCHTALTTIKKVWTGTKWFIEGDIRGCFNNIEHSVLLGILRRDITDNRFLRLIQNLIRAGYLEDWRLHPTLSGSPQGGTVSPILSNIYLDQLDQFVKQTLIPEYTKGNRRAKNPDYNRISSRARYCRRTGRGEEAKALEAARRAVPANDPHDPNYRRLYYVRYADDFLLGFAGPRSEAEAIRDRLSAFLAQELRLELSAEKTLITHAHTEKARFLGYDISVAHCDTKIAANRRSVNGVVTLRMPPSFVAERSRFYTRDGKPIHRMERTHDSDYSIVCGYQAEYRGFVQYYQLADNIAWLNRLHWVMQTSLLKTLAHKHRSSVAKLARRFKAKVETPHGPRTCLEVRVTREGKPPLVGRFGGLPLRTTLSASIDDRLLARKSRGRSELLQRVLADACEACGSTENVEVHHVRKLADLNRRNGRPPPDWVRLMASRRRKTLVLCRVCHDNIHAGRPLRPKSE
ncbi:Group II intron-encoded protein LtrA [Gemmata sp. SH-PL17]|uniref:reverse transcriptase/maturase family protein n=1 Tax=Gemmata sp. SH-PL17 TaxID=1630693 RepID=UPI00078CAFC4|nr:reverse transcriptase/maturase family protein [Gemmata sp. SH-PL17]AMV24029.1 Group II intron-encoded protein LtrA [Gemmata sp. SH-PL17]